MASTGYATKESTLEIRLKRIRTFRVIKENFPKENLFPHVYVIFPMEHECNPSGVT